MKEKDLTAVEWYNQQIVERQNGNGDSRSFDEIVEQAKEMEKEQIMRTARQCYFEGVRKRAKTTEELIEYAEQYYNETFKSE
jgi:HEPN domain-containing protein